jgi:membrane-associated protease RseP (regulator of RpoE activity)
MIAVHRDDHAPRLGHFVMAKRAGMKVTGSSSSFGPRLWSVAR